MKNRFVLTSVVFLGLLLVAYQVAGRVHKTVVLERVFDAEVIEVWQTWTTPETIKQWWGPRGYSAPVVRQDFKEGGEFLLSMKAPDGSVVYNAGRYLAIVPLQEIVTEMWFANDQGQKVPASSYGVLGHWLDQQKVTVTFANEDGKTRVRVEETGIPLIMSVFAKMGWEQQFEKLDAILLL